jgi:hypothetical protein
MPRLSKITLGIAGLWFLGFTAFAALPSGLTQLFSMLLTLGLLVFGFVSFVRVFTHWRQERWRSIIPVGACALAVVLAPEIGGLIRQFMFQRSLPHYESILRQMESGSIPVSVELDRVPQAESSLAYAVLAQRANGVLSVEFLTGGGFPVKQSGYLYCSSGVIERGSLIDSRWPKRRKVRPLWFRISD